MLTRKIGVIGGDLRIVRLCEMFSNENYTIYTNKLDKYSFNNDNILECENIKKITDNCKYIISGIPFSKEGVYLNAPFSNKSIKVDDLLKQLENKILIAGAIDKTTKEKAKLQNIEINDLMDIEELTILNIIPTVEGAIQIAMEQTEFTIHSSRCLVLGFGRIGKLLSKTLKSLGAEVSCVARKESDLAWIKTFRYNVVHINDLKKDIQKNNYDIIFNTIPAIVLDEENLKVLKNKNTLIIELASKPGGIDLEKAEEYNLKVIKAQGLPGKVAPKTAAKYIKDTLENLIFNK